MGLMMVVYEAMVLVTHGITYDEKYLMDLDTP
jgi:hypothetical protein